MSYDFHKASQTHDTNETVTIRTTEYGAKYKTGLSIEDTHDLRLAALYSPTPMVAAKTFMGREIKKVIFMNNRYWIYHE